MERTSTRTRVGAPVRLASGPSHLRRLGHCVLDVLDFRASEASYKERFGLVTSDEIALDEHIALGAFLRCDQGERYVDHHTLFRVGAGRARFNHAAFEVSVSEVALRGSMPLAQHHDVMRMAERRFAFPLFNELRRSILLTATQRTNSGKRGHVTAPLTR